MLLLTILLQRVSRNCLQAHRKSLLCQNHVYINILFLYCGGLPHYVSPEIMGAFYELFCKGGKLHDIDLII